MPVDVVDALKTVLSQEGGMTDQKVEEYVKNLERERRFQTETWSWHWRPVGLLLLQLFLLMVNRFVDGNLLQALYSVYVCWMSVAEETAFACDEIVFFLVLMIKLIMIVTHYYPSSKKLMPSSETLPQGLRVHAYGACHVFRSSSSQTCHVTCILEKQHLWDAEFTVLQVVSNTPFLQGIRNRNNGGLAVQSLVCMWGKWGSNYKWSTHHCWIQCH